MTAAAITRCDMGTSRRRRQPVLRYLGEAQREGGGGGERQGEREGCCVREGGRGGMEAGREMLRGCVEKMC